MWVRSEYAGELAVVSAWLCALLPWSISHASTGGARVVRIHFVYLYFQFFPGIALTDGAVRYRLVTGAAGGASHPGVATGYRLWMLAAAVFTLALLLSALYYVNEERLEAESPVDPVRLMGALLVVPAVLLTGTSYYLATGLPGVSVPVGVAFMYVLGGLLLVVDRT